MPLLSDKSFAESDLTHTVLQQELPLCTHTTCNTTQTPHAVKGSARHSMCGVAHTLQYKQRMRHVDMCVHRTCMCRPHATSNQPYQTPIRCATHAACCAEPSTHTKEGRKRSTAATLATARLHTTPTHTQCLSCCCCSCVPAPPPRTHTHICTVCCLGCCCCLVLLHAAADELVHICQLAGQGRALCQQDLAAQAAVKAEGLVDRAQCCHLHGCILADAC